MGTKISWEYSEKAGLQVEDKIICEPNKYGYRVNINHPKIKPLYERFKRSRKAIILSDRERLEFESIIISKVKRSKKS